MNDEIINVFIQIRGTITSLQSFEHLLDIVDRIDAELSKVPIGRRPDVDALLGRTPNNVQYVIVAQNHILAEDQWTQGGVTCID